MISTICICGAGTMGSGIAQVSAAAEFKTLLYDLNEDMVQKAKVKIQKDLQALVDKKRITDENRAAILERIHFTSRISECVADLVIEAIVEKADVKVALFNQLASINTPDTIFATNTSSLSVSEIANGVKHPERVAGLHFFNPAPVMKLVEIIKGRQTSDKVMTELAVLTKRMGKITVICTDAPGFIVNRVARPYYIESLRLAEEGHSDFATIDRVLESRGFRMGPFKLMDLIGNDVNYAVSCSVYDQLGRPERLKPSHIQNQLVENGHLGKKSGKGYYNYSSNS